MTRKQFIGVDVAQDWLDIANTVPPSRQSSSRQSSSRQSPGSSPSQPGPVLRIPNTPDAIAGWLATLDPACVGLVAFEPTGGLERPLRQALAAAALPFCRVHPNEVVAFRTCRGIKAKTDQIDAALLARFAEQELATRGIAPVVEGDDVLRDLVARRRQLVDARQAERCRLARATTPAVQDSIGAVLALLTGQLDAIDRAVAAHVKARPPLAALSAMLQSFKGCGPIVAATMLGEVPELGRLSGKQIAALLGLAPQTRDSGKAKGRATTGHGRPGVRQVLFNAARCAIRWNPVMRSFYERLTTHNKRPGKVALTAVMRKILVTLNAIARDGQPWRGQASPSPHAS